jgi:hypothetical protein
MISACLSPGTGTQTASAASQSATYDQAWLGLSGRTDPRGWVAIRWNASSDAQGSPIRAQPHH